MSFKSNDTKLERALTVRKIGIEGYRTCSTQAVHERRSDVRRAVALMRSQRVRDPPYRLKREGSASSTLIKAALQKGAQK